MEFSPCDVSDIFVTNAITIIEIILHKIIRYGIIEASKKHSGVAFAAL